MKRNKILLVSSALLLLTGCNSGNQLRGKQAFPRNGESDHVTYLVLSAVGQYQGATIVDKDDNLFLERFVKFNGAANSDLPGEDVITASSGAKFAGWVSYEGTGALTYYTKVPEQSGKILYAYFGGGSGSQGGGGSGGGGGGQQTSQGGQTSQDTPSGELDTITTKYGIRNKDTGKYLCALNPSDTKDMQGRDQATANNVSFKAGTKVQLYDTSQNAGWIVTIDPYSFGGSATSPKFSEYLTAGTDYWTVVKDFSADVYAKFKMNDDQIYFGLK